MATLSHLHPLYAVLHALPAPTVVYSLLSHLPPSALTALCCASRSLHLYVANSISEIFFPVAEAQAPPSQIPDTVLPSPPSGRFRGERIISTAATKAGWLRGVHLVAGEVAQKLHEELTYHFHTWARPYTTPGYDDSDQDVVAAALFNFPGLQEAYVWWEPGPRGKHGHLHAVSATLAAPGTRPFALGAALWSACADVLDPMKQPSFVPYRSVFPVTIDLVLFDLVYGAKCSTFVFFRCVHVWSEDRIRVLPGELQLRVILSAMAAAGQKLQFPPSWKTYHNDASGRPACPGDLYKGDFHRLTALAEIIKVQLGDHPLFHEVVKLCEEQRLIAVRSSNYYIKLKQDPMAWAAYMNISRSALAVWVLANPEKVIARTARMVAGLEQARKARCETGLPYGMSINHHQPSGTIYLQVAITHAGKHVTDINCRISKHTRKCQGVHSSTIKGGFAKQYIGPGRLLTYPQHTRNLQDWITEFFPHLTLEGHPTLLWSAMSANLHAARAKATREAEKMDTWRQVWLDDDLRRPRGHGHARPHAARGAPVRGAEGCGRQVWRREEEAHQGRRQGRLQDRRHAGPLQDRPLPHAPCAFLPRPAAAAAGQRLPPVTSCSTAGAPLAGWQQHGCQPQRRAPALQRRRHPPQAQALMPHQKTAGAGSSVPRLAGHGSGKDSPRTVAGHLSSQALPPLLPPPPRLYGSDVATASAAAPPCFEEAGLGSGMDSTGFRCADPVGLAPQYSSLTGGSQPASSLGGRQTNQPLPTRLGDHGLSGAGRAPFNSLAVDSSAGIGGPCPGSSAPPHGVLSMHHLPPGAVGGSSAGGSATPVRTATGDPWHQLQPPPRQRGPAPSPADPAASPSSFGEAGRGSGEDMPSIRRAAPVAQAPHLSSLPGRLQPAPTPASRQPLQALLARPNDCGRTPGTGRTPFGSLAVDSSGGIGDPSLWSSAPSSLPPHGLLSMRHHLLPGTVGGSSGSCAGGSAPTPACTAAGDPSFQLPPPPPRPRGPAPPPADPAATRVFLSARCGRRPGAGSACIDLTFDDDGDVVDLASEDFEPPPLKRLRR